MAVADEISARRRSPARWAIRLLPGLAALVIGYRVLAARRSELSGAAAALGHLRAPWVAAAALAELGSLAAYAALQRRLLASAEVTVARAPMLGITMAGYAIQNSLPAGPAWSAVFAFRELRRRGAGAVAVGWMLVLASVLSDVGLLALGLAGLILAQGHDAGFGVAEVVLSLAAVVGAVVAVIRFGPRSERGLALATSLLRWFRRLARRPPGDPQESVRSAATRLRAVRPTRSDWARASTFALANWVSDCACLALAFGAVGAPVPWRGLLLAYGTGQLAANLPITPGGLGVVEGSLSIALVFYGGTERTTVAAVLLYRIISFWCLLPVGWASWAVLRGINRRRRPPATEGAA
ncbi:MAG TPA: YbhN family protein [Acidimicrobiales bacterium]|nr:YbhN family protein [Acidimicrobiales bacterium]